MSDELFDLVDDADRVIGTASRSQCHGDTTRIHRAVHVFVFTTGGELYLQRRSAKKLIQPGKWDTSVGGHLSAGESYYDAAIRETSEELGFCPTHLDIIFSSKVRNQVESENITAFVTIYDGTIIPLPEEIDEGRHWRRGEITASLGRGIFTPVFEQEFDLLVNVDHPAIRKFG